MVLNFRELKEVFFNTCNKNEQKREMIRGLAEDLRLYSLIASSQLPMDFLNFFSTDLRFFKCKMSGSLFNWTDMVMMNKGYHTELKENEKL